MRQGGSHLRLRHLHDPTRLPLTVPDHRDLKPGLLRRLIRDARLTTESRSRYRRAVEWLAQCLEFGAGARLGEDTREAQVALAEAFLGLGERDRAWEMTRSARHAAQKAGNQLDLASALAVMASLLWLKGAREEASACAEDAAARFDQLGHPSRAAKIRQGLEKKALFFGSGIG